MQKYHQLTLKEREEISVLRQSGLSKRKIALAMGRPPSTISRDLNRNEGPTGHYWPDRAQKKARQRRKKVSLLDQHQALKDFVITQLQCHFWTPEQIAGWLKNRQKDLPSLSHESIYAWICHPTQKHEKLWKYLPRHKAKRGLKKKPRGRGDLHS